MADKCHICGCLLDAPGTEWCPTNHTVDPEKEARVTEEITLSSGSPIPAGATVRIVSELADRTVIVWADDKGPRRSTLRKNRDKVVKCAG